MDKEIFIRLVERIKNDKKLLIIILAILIGIILTVISFIPVSDKNINEDDVSAVTEFNESVYIEQLENKLSEMIALVNGAGRTRVIVTLECDYETVYAKDGRLSKDDDSTDEDSEYIIIDSKETQSGLLLKTVTPKVRGVAVVCEGGDSMYVRNAVTEMLSAVLDIGINRISVAKIQ